MGAKKWNTLSTEENEKYDYYDRPREQRAKAAATVVEEEYQR